MKIIIVLIFSCFLIEFCTAQSTGLKLLTKEEYESIDRAEELKIQADLPKIFDLCNIDYGFPLPGHQGNQNSCVGWALAYAIKTYQEAKEEKKIIVSDNSMDSNLIFSPSFIYNNLNEGKDDGIQMDEGMNFLKEKGCAKLQDFPYDDKNYTNLPNDKIFVNASRYKITSYKSFELPINVQEVKERLFIKFPILIAVEINNNLKHLYNTKNGCDDTIIWRNMDFPKKRSSKEYHAVVIVGYNDSLQAFKIFNSWGSDSCFSGCFYIPYNLINKCLKEAYIIYDKRNY